GGIRALRRGVMPMEPTRSLPGSNASPSSSRPVPEGGNALSAPSEAAGPRGRLRTMAQISAYDSPWSLRSRLKLVLWMIVSATLFHTTPKPLYRWRVLLLRLFGAKIRGHVFVASSAVVKMPWNLTMENRACLSPSCELYNLAPVTLKAR